MYILQNSYYATASYECYLEINDALLNPILNTFSNIIDIYEWGLEDSYITLNRNYVKVGYVLNT